MSVNGSSETYFKILSVTEELIGAKGVGAATTRAVAVAAGVQAPTIYRLFGDKEGLLNAVAEHAMKNYADQKAKRKALNDPIEDMRVGWDSHIDFGLSHPGIIAIMTARIGASHEAPAIQQGLAVLRAKIHALAEAGCLRLPEDRALNLFHAAATGTILALLRQPEAGRDMALSGETREAAIWALTGSASNHGVKAEVRSSIALRAKLPEMKMLTPGERLLLSELLDRIGN